MLVQLLLLQTLFVSYLQPPAAWVHAQLESRELMCVCLKKLKGLNKASHDLRVLINK